jgi:O-antigen/teichoic acid export membrane protein
MNNPSQFRKLLSRAGVDRASAWAVMARSVQVVTGGVTMLLIAFFFSKGSQGYYYTFFSLIALKTFVELGFAIVVTNTASHEWSRLSIDSDGRIQGDPAALSRLVSLGRLVVKWYASAALVFIAVAGAAGFIFFNMPHAAEEPEEAIVWQAPFAALVLAIGLQLVTTAMTAFLEGCNQVIAVNRMRFWEAILSAAAAWACILAGGGLWTAAAFAGVNFLCEAYLLLAVFRRFFEPFRRPPDGPSMHWRTEIWPMQWRLAVSGLVGYFSFWLFNPVIFHYHGEAEAGRMGMTLQIVAGLQGVSLAFIYTKVPRFGILVAQKNYAELDRFWRRAASSAMGLYIACAAFAAGVVAVLPILDWPLARHFSGRILPLAETAIFLAGAGLMTFSICILVYLRAHKEEPAMLLSAATGLAVGAAVVVLGSRWGSLGAAWGYMGLLSAGDFVLVWFWLRWRVARHAL